MTPQDIKELMVVGAACLLILIAAASILITIAAKAIKEAPDSEEGKFNRRNRRHTTNQVLNPLNEK